MPITTHLGLGMLEKHGQFLSGDELLEVAERLAGGAVDDGGAAAAPLDAGGPGPEHGLQQGVGAGDLDLDGAVAEPVDVAGRRSAARALDDVHRVPHRLRLDERVARLARHRLDRDVHPLQRRVQRPGRLAQVRRQTGLVDVERDLGPRAAPRGKRQLNNLLPSHG